MSKKSYMWDRNNAFAYSDPTGYSPKQQLPTVLRDKHGNAVIGASGKPALIPGGFDVKGVLSSGKNDAILINSIFAPIGYLHLYADLKKFQRGKQWDIQRLRGGRFQNRFRDGATIIIGMFSVEAGMSRNEILFAESRGTGTYPPGTKMDPKYTTLPVTNVKNTDIGRQLIKSGSYP